MVSVAVAAAVSVVLGVVHGVVAAVCVAEAALFLAGAEDIGLEEGECFQFTAQQLELLPLQQLAMRETGTPTVDQLIELPLPSSVLIVSFYFLWDYFLLIFRFAIS